MPLSMFAESLNASQGIGSKFVILITATIVLMNDAQAERPEGERPEGESNFPAGVNWFLQTYCYECHDAGKSKGGVRLDNISQDLIKGAHGDDWHEALDALRFEEMPPEEAKKQPTAEERQKMIEFLEGAFEEAKKERRSTGGKVVLRRLTNYEYDNTLNELLALDGNFSKDFPADNVSEDGFRNNGNYMAISSLQMENYLTAAQHAMDEAIYMDEANLTGKRPDAKKVDIKEVKFFRGRHKGKMENFEIKQRNIGGLLVWPDHPKQGPVLLEVTLSGVKQPKNLLGVLKLNIGCRARKKGSPLFSFVEFPGRPLITDADELVHLRYLIPRIEDFPVPDDDHNWRDLVLELWMPGGNRGMKVVSMKAQGPYYETWPPESHRRIFIESDNQANEEVYAREILGNFMTRAWRRPVTSSEIDQFHGAYKRQRQTKSFVDSIKGSLVRVLVSPNFLYLMEPKVATESNQSEKLSPHELATRLSYFLWASTPDERLFELASKGELAKQEILRSEVERLVQDQRSWNFVQAFTTQWLGLDRINSVSINPEVYPSFDDSLKKDMKGETQHFFAYLLRENQSALNLIDSDFTFLNERLKIHYAGPKSGRMDQASEVFEKVAFGSDEKRGGVLGHASIHLANSNGEDSHAISRGVWLVDKIVGNPPPEPPMNIELDTSIEGFDKMTLKQQLQAHVENESCARCHMKIDPFGVAFEHFDATGAFRDKIRRIDHEELAQRMEAAKSGPAAKEAFQKFDKDRSGYLAKEEFVVYLEQSDDPQLRSMAAKGWDRLYMKIAGIENDREQNSHPPKTISFHEFKTHLMNDREKKIKEVQSDIPYRYIPVDARTELPDNTKIGGLEDLQTYLLENKRNEIAENIVRRLLTYALGRSLEFSDDQIVKQLTQGFVADNYRIASLIQEIVLSEPFQTK